MKSLQKADLQIRLLLPIDGGDLLPVDLREVMERERVLDESASQNAW